MRLESPGEIAHAVEVSVTTALRELLDGEPQIALANRMQAAGLRVDQSKISAWKRGRIPHLYEFPQLEEFYGKPRGWILRRAGLVTDEAIASVDPIEAEPAITLELARRVKQLEDQLAELVRGAQPAATPLRRVANNPKGSKAGKSYTQTNRPSPSEGLDD